MTTEQVDGRAKKRGKGTRRRAKLADVAALAGVSIKTVSRAVNNDPRVAPDTEQRVRAAIKELGYQPNLAARSLRSGADDTIGLIVDSVADPFFASIVGAVENELDRHGYAVLAASSRKVAEREQALITRLVQRTVSGCILVPTHTTQIPDVLHGVPLVLLDRLPDAMDVDAVLVEDRAASRNAVQHLLAHGHRRIAFVGDFPNLQTTSERLEGYREALVEAGLPVDETLVKAVVSSSVDAFEVTRDLLARQDAPTAIFAAGTRQASGVVSAMTDEQRRRVALISFGDFPLADALEPGLTVISHDPQQLARQAVDLLLRRISDPGAPSVVIRMPLELVQRGSGEVQPNA